MCGYGWAHCCTLHALCVGRCEAGRSHSENGVIMHDGQRIGVELEALADRILGRHSRLPLIRPRQRQAYPLVKALGELIPAAVTLRAAEQPDYSLPAQCAEQEQARSIAARTTYPVRPCTETAH